MITFRKFNELYNGVRKGYVVLRDGKLTDNTTPLSFTEILEVANTDPNLEIGWILPENFIVINIDDASDYVLKIIQAREEKVMCVRTPTGIQIFARSNYNHRTSKNILAIGCWATTVPYGTGRTFVLTPFKNPNINTSSILAGREIVYYNGIDRLPFWLMPLHKQSQKENIITFPLEDTKKLTEHFFKLRKSSLDKEERKECIEIMNKYICSNPLSDQQVKEISNSLPVVNFFEGSSFHHDAMGNFLIDYLKIKKDARTHVLRYYDENERLYIANNDYIKGVMTQLCPQLKDFQKKETLNYIENLLELHLTEFSKDPYKISFLNGRLDLRTMYFEPSTCEHLETIHLHVNWNPDAKGETADEFFRTATCGDQDCEQLLYEAIGYSFIKTSSLQKAFLLYGGGRNGKSTYLDIIKTICGHENCTSVSFKDLGEKFRVSELHNKLVSLSGDISAQPLKDSDLFKQIIGGDEITIERKNQHPFTDTVFATLFFSANKLPRTPDTTYGFYRKLVIIPFNANLSKVSLVDGATFHEKLMEDAEYIAYKAVLAIKDVLIKSHKFTEPESATNVMIDYKTENSSILSWKKAKRLAVEDLTKETFDEIYAKYTLWCDMNGYKSVRSARFEQEVEEEFGLVHEGDRLTNK